jgi:hypothetical protein
MSLPTLEKYAHLLLPIEVTDDNVKINQFFLQAGNPDDYIAVQVPDNKFKLMPGPEFSPRLYRGQNRRYCKCTASIYRVDSSQSLLWQIKRWELNKLLLKSPIVQGFSAMQVCDCSASIDFESLAQHYEFYTEMLDFTRDKEIATFFALCRKNDDDSWCPIEETEKPVIYCLNMKEMINSGDGLNIVGMQPLLRPGLQKAFSIKLHGTNDLNTRSYATCKEIEMSRSRAEEYCEKFNNGRALFPKEIVSDKINKLRESRYVDKEIIDGMFRHNKFPSYIKNENDLRKRLSYLGITIKDKTDELLFSDLERAKMAKQWPVMAVELDSRIKRRCCHDSIER